LLGPIIGALFLAIIKYFLGTQTLLDNHLIIGLLLIGVILWCPRGVSYPILKQIGRQSWFSNFKNRRKTLGQFDSIHNIRHGNDPKDP
ncbi:MAG: hypothetical protein AAF403_01625, partial [Pseudomonadota bacterium]